MYMNDSTLMLCLVLGILFGTVTVIYMCQAEKDIRELNTKVIKLKEICGVAEANIDILQRNVAGLNKTIQALRDGHSEDQWEITVLKTQLVGVDRQLAELKQAVNDPAKEP